MAHNCPLSGRHKTVTGFTLVELIIAVAIIVVLAVIALPSYQGQVRKARRAEALTFMSQVQQAQERYRANISKYGDKFVLSGGGLSRVISNIDPDSATYGSAASTYTTSGGYYSLGLADVTASGYSVFANAQGDQVNDALCKFMQMSLAGGNIAYSSGSSSSTLNGAAANSRCWNR